MGRTFGGLFQELKVHRKRRHLFLSGTRFPPHPSGFSSFRGQPGASAGSSASGGAETVHPNGPQPFPLHLADCNDASSADNLWRRKVKPDS